MSKSSLTVVYKNEQRKTPETRKEVVDDCLTWLEEIEKGDYMYMDHPKTVEEILTDLKDKLVFNLRNYLKFLFGNTGSM